VDFSKTEDDLKRAALFSGLAPQQISKLAAVARPLRLAGGRTVFLQDAPAEAFYLLVDGGVKIYKSLRDGRTATMRHVGPGETFGESVLFNPAYPANAETMAPSFLYRFPLDAFRDVLRAEPELALALLGAMARLLVLLNRRVEELLLPVPARLARYVLTLCNEQASLVCSLPVSKQELAARLGTVPETLSRTLNRLTRSGVLTVDGQRITVGDPQALERLAQR
jgi:CRP/FNR family transcriptional regulator, dissimilatory nitrate respiration regulator